MLKQDHCRHTPYRMHSKRKSFTDDKPLGYSLERKVKRCIGCGQPILQPAFIYSKKYYTHYHWISALITAFFSIIIQRLDIEICKISAGIFLISFLLGFLLSCLILPLIDQFLRYLYPWETIPKGTDEIVPILEKQRIQQTKGKTEKILAIFRGTIIMANSIFLANYLIWLLLLLILMSIVCSIIFRRYYLLWFAVFFSPLALICYFINDNSILNILIGFLLTVWIAFMEIRNCKK
ncbi:MAG: hypothetical protein E7329_08015 [Clostridiales bacterium]|nr:hypothetical protein [Clostridiales bacterium]